MKLYVLATDDDRHYPYYEKAFTNRNTAERVLCNLPVSNYEVKEIELPYVGKYVCYVHAYYGFNYGWRSIYDVEEDSDVYHCIDAAKGSPIWQKLMERIEMEGKENYVIRDTANEHLIASKDSFHDYWFYGDVMEGKFYARIHRIRVVKETYGDMRRRINAMVDALYR